MDRNAIGVFDSGIGGLTAVKELRKLTGSEDIIYFGDTGRVPYGTRSRSTIQKYASQSIDFLLQNKVKYVVAACGTVSSNVTQEFIDSLGVGYTGVISLAAKAAVEATKNKKIGVIGTTATIKSLAFDRALKALNPVVKVFSQPAPLFVSLVENGLFSSDNAIAKLTVEMYLSDIKNSGIDTLILGCTHFPLLKEVIANYMGEEITLIDPGLEAAKFAYSEIDRLGILSDNSSGKSSYYVSDDPDSFCENANIYLGYPIDGTVKEIDIDKFEGVKIWKKK